MEIGVVGRNMFTTGFRLVGVHKWFQVDDRASSEQAVAQALKDREIGVLVIHDTEWQELEEKTQMNLSNSVHPTVIAIGAEVDDSLRDRIRTAVGVDLWK
ncbi:MAG: V-type ATP synthase subunit F [Candidatus Poseidoniia archaeon]|jgi:V/A-type H+-transporting ATPase subunit F|uniref:A-type ATP synthase subunit F n=1 Tax=Marine Group III euryarchaeote TaxID=2173149 RepID=A0A7C7ZE48_9ARCH|nr:V-type ATP synthase subunit F [Candidatus Poseidoniia archaeon]MDP7590686.1 V-type ATP synthase subunit F [Candidatus Poseidoniia archaeon]RZD31672.1 MAG: V-type ATP synthase subunit F [Euryarchaeota archaeon]HIG63761.1 V-type ATP synthase subunit F [Marine Group III euryarchaeote]HIL33660.1 V-type ATP synthase subunit F [Candidatus Poseidoniales archaeon]|tara:strand:+ start:207 stop:506 length:300 start_codon:yes stop_codon:yes gene_type:complete